MPAISDNSPAPARARPRLWEWLTTPAPAVRGGVSARQSRLLATLLLALIPVVLLFGQVILPVLFNSRSPLGTSVFAIASGANAFLLAAFVANRLGRYHLASWLTILVCMIAPAAAALGEQGGSTGRTPILATFMVVSVLFASLLVDGRSVIIVGVLDMVILAQLAALMPVFGVTVFAPLAVVVLLLTALVEVYTRHRRALEDERQAELEQAVADRTRELAEANEQLRVMGDIRSEFIDSISHELRTPLTTIKMNHELLRRDPSRAREFIGRLERETSRLQQIVEQLLQVSQMNQGPLVVRIGPVSLNEMVLRLAEDRQPLAEAHGLSLQVETEPGLPMVQADPALMAQVMSILLTNAINYTPARGRVTLATRARRIEGRDYAGFAVSDSGPGIAPGEQAQVFERFYRGETGKKSMLPGTGLGLAIARTLVEMHAGRIELESGGVPGQGVTFRVWLPVDGQAAG